MAWTDRMVEELKSLWQTGLTTSEIAKKLGVSKNSIVGKVHRLSLSGRPSPIKKKEEIKKTKAIKIKRAEKKPVAAPEPKEAPAPAEKALPEKHIKNEEKSDIVRLTDLDNHTCRWPLGDPKDENFHFCGKKTRTGQTYCDEHSAIAYVKPLKK